MCSPQELPQDSHCLPSLRQLNQMRVFSPGNSWIRLAQHKHAHVKTPGIKPAHDLAGIPHLSVGQASVGKAVHKNANRFQLPRSSETALNLIRPARVCLRPLGPKFSRLRSKAQIQISCVVSLGYVLLRAFQQMLSRIACRLQWMGFSWIGTEFE